MFKNKKVLVTGGTGLIGRCLVDLLIDRGAHVRIASLDDPSRAHPSAEFHQVNLMEFENCKRVCQGMDYVFHLAGIKGSPAMTAEKPASFFVPLLTFNTNMMEAAWQSNVEKYLFTSSVGVYAPADIFREDDVWETFPSPHDRYSGWAKRMGELQAEVYGIEHDWNDIHIVRPANVYGPYDNFDPNNAMVIPSLIKRAMDGENPLTVWGDGTPIRDFIHAQDVARGMLLVVEKGITKPVNLGSGTGVSIKEIVEAIVSNIDPQPDVNWDITKPAGDSKRIMDISRARGIGFEAQISIAEGIKEVMDWYAENRDLIDKRFNVFTKTK
jgi:GDP-L-fucose synthase